MSPPVHNLTPLRAATLLWEARPAQHALTVCVAGAFRLAPSGELVAAPEVPWPSELAELPPLKPRTDVLVVGSAYSPWPSGSVELVASVTLGSVRKSVKVVGQGPFRAAPLAGGRTHLEPTDPEHTSSLGALPWTARSARLEERAWAESVLRGAPAGPPAPDFDFGCFQLAPREQQAELVAPNAPVELSHLWPAPADGSAPSPLVTLRLPAARPQVFRLAAEGGRPTELPLRCDTVVIDTDRLLVWLAWRGVTPLAGAAASHLVVVMEPSGQRVRPDAVPGLWAAHPSYQPSQREARATSREPAEERPAAERLDQRAERVVHAHALPAPLAPAPGPTRSSTPRPPPPVPAAVHPPLGAADPSPPPPPFAALPPLAPPQPRAPQPLAPPQPRHPAPASVLEDEPTGHFVVEPHPSAARPELLPVPSPAPPPRTPPPPPPPRTPPRAGSHTAPPPPAVSSHPASRPAPPLLSPPRQAAADSLRLPPPPPVAVHVPARPTELTMAARLAADPAALAKAATPPDDAVSSQRPARAKVVASEPLAPEAPETDRLIELEEQAQLAARIAARPDERHAILRDAKLRPDHYEASAKSHQEAMGQETSRGRSALLRRYDEAYVAEQSRLRGGDLDDAMYARLSVAAERGQAPRALADAGLTMPDFMRLQRVFTRRSAEDAAVAARLRAAIDAARKA